MFRQIFIIIFIISIAGINSSAMGFYPFKNAEAHIKKALKIKALKIEKEVTVDDALLRENAIVIYQVKNQESNTTFYALFAEAKGRIDKFDYLLIVNDSFEIELVKVVKYRSEHGGEIASKKWLSQFQSFSGGDLKYGKEISAISGATLSAKSITKDIPRVLKILKSSCN